MLGLLHFADTCAGRVCQVVQTQVAPDCSPFYYVKLPLLVYSYRIRTELQEETPKQRYAVQNLHYRPTNYLQQPAILPSRWGTQKGTHSLLTHSG